MQSPVRANSLQSYQMIVYSRALHPELFQLKGRKVFNRGQYELEAWLMHGMHVLRFAHEGVTACELLTGMEKSPTSGMVSAFLAAGERDFEHRFEKGRVVYMTTVQTETLTENLYDATYEELSRLQSENRAPAVRWNDDAGRCLSLSDVQLYNDQVHVQCYHMIANGGVVIRTQTLFEHK